MLWLKLFVLVGAVVGSGCHHAPPRSSGGPRTGFRPHLEEYTAEYWVTEAQNAIRRRQQRVKDDRVARNVVLFLGDGMSIPTLAAARTLLGQRQGTPGEEAELSFESFPVTGLAKTYCVDHQIADSACSATAYLCGVKNNLGTVGVTAAVPYNDCEASTNTARHVDSIAAWALENGMDAGIVTTTRVTHASPSGAYAKSASRYFENDGDVLYYGHDVQRCPDIAHQLITSSPGRDFKVIFGGGRREFLPNTTIDQEGAAGRRVDGRNLIQEWIDQKEANGSSHAYVWNKEQLLSHYEFPPEYMLGLFESSHLQYNLQSNFTTEPTLTELTEMAIRSLRRNENGFFLFVEGGRIDHAHHDNLVHLALDETIEFSRAVGRASQLLSEEDSLLVVTADHAHVMAVNGYTARGSDILGPSDDRDWHDVPYMTLSYTNGPGWRRQQDGVRPNVLEDEDYGSLSWLSHADIPLEWETHGGDDVAVFARGPQEGMFTGLYEQSHVAHLMAYAGCFGAAGRGQPHCNSASALSSLGPSALASLALALYVSMRALLA